MTVKVSSIGLKGLDGYRVQVEVQASPGMESVVIVGLPDTSVKESKERVLSTIRSLGCNTIDQKIVVNLSPSEQKKNGPFFDLAMAIAILKEIEELKQSIPEDTVFLGALSLDGTIEKVEGMLPALIAAKKLGFKKAFIPADPLIPLHMFDGIECHVVQHIQDVIHYLNGQSALSLTLTPHKIEQPKLPKFEKDFSHIIGHDFAKEALEIAAAGRHNLFMSGPPGCGKSMLAETFPTILPPLTNSEQLEVISLYQLAKESVETATIAPFRAPHHSASSTSIIGGGTYPKPGEISLAHNGVLFLDEMAEFSKKTLDMLRQPLESGIVTISRVHSTVTYPASFILLGATNPCPCGYLGSHTHYCTCTQKQIQSYRNRISGPIYDRFDIFLHLNSVDLTKDEKSNEPSSTIRKRVEMAQQMQFDRYKQQIYNGNVSFELLRTVSPITTTQERMLSQVAAKQNWSNRVQIKIIRLARTISDLLGEENIIDESIWKAIQLRRTYDTKVKQLTQKVNRG